MSCVSLVDLSLEMATLFEFQVFRNRPSNGLQWEFCPYTRLYKKSQKHQRRSRYIKLLYTRPCDSSLKQYGNMAL